uniref:Uncharacterized protein n=1 Tax=Molossus molossus TaxID=27622 RepID=A0A7J8I0M5_MOLMO|nr:hypothetical protein HJG59_010741 [Molossus molossus]
MPRAATGRRRHPRQPWGRPRETPALPTPGLGPASRTAETTPPRCKPSRGAVSTAWAHCSYTRAGAPPGRFALWPRSRPPWLLRPAQHRPAAWPAALQASLPRRLFPHGAPQKPWRHCLRQPAPLLPHGAHCPEQAVRVLVTPGTCPSSGKSLSWPRQGPARPLGRIYFGKLV